MSEPLIGKLIQLPSGELAEVLDVEHEYDDGTTLRYVSGDYTGSLTQRDTHAIRRYPVVPRHDPSARLVREVAELAVDDPAPYSSAKLIPRSLWEACRAAAASPEQVREDTERMDDPFHAEWFEFCRGLTREQTDLVLRYTERERRRARESALREVEEALRDWRASDFPDQRLSYHEAADFIRDKLVAPTGEAPDHGERDG